MQIYNRPYDDAQDDFARMWAFLIQDYAYRRDQFIWLFSRFGDWKFGLWNYKKHFPSFYRKNAQLWLNHFHELEGFVISEEGDNTFTLFTRRGYDSLADEMLAWVITHWGTRATTLRIEVHEHQAQTITLLERCGFQNKGQIAVTRQYDLTGTLAPQIPLGSEYQIVDMVTNQNFAARMRLIKDGFQDQDTVSEMDMLTFEYARECPCYNPAFDLSAITNDGIHTSTCVGFVDYENRVAEVEKVCTHHAYRRKHLAQAVILECFRRLKAAGFEYAYITGYSDAATDLYGKLGHVRQKRWDLYELPTGVIS
jgi:ribosomal protein S18 acetylase RimI-like enzyme